MRSPAHRWDRLHSQANFARAWHAEVDAALGALLFYLSVYSDGFTYGQTLQNVTFRNAFASRPTPATRWQRVLLGIALVGLPYGWHRAKQRALVADDPWWRRWMHRVETGAKALALVNMAAFLWSGRYPRIWERVFGLRMDHVSPVRTRSVAYEYMNRQLVWQGFTEFLLFAAPLVNVDRLQNFFRRFVAPASPNSGPSQCGICGADPMVRASARGVARHLTGQQHNPHASEACGHASCYFCVASKLQEDPKVRLCESKCC